MIRNEIAGVLYAASRPGYDGCLHLPVDRPVVDAWLAEARSVGVRSILCLLDDRHLCLYGELAGGLTGYCQAAGFQVVHLPVADHQAPPVPAEQLREAARHFAAMPKPVLVHCSAGIGRTGAVVAHLKGQLADAAPPSTYPGHGASS